MGGGGGCGRAHRDSEESASLQFDYTHHNEGATFQNFYLLRGMKQRGQAVEQREDRLRPKMAAGQPVKGRRRRWGEGVGRRMRSGTGQEVRKRLSVLYAWVWVHVCMGECADMHSAGIHTYMYTCVLAFSPTCIYLHIHTSTDHTSSAEVSTTSLCGSLRPVYDTYLYKWHTRTRTHAKTHTCVRAYACTYACLQTHKHTHTNTLVGGLARG